MLPPILEKYKMDEEDWELLLRDVGAGKVVPVIGPDLLAKGDDCGPTLHRHLMEVLQGRFPEHGHASTLLELCSSVPKENRADLEKAIRTGIRDWPRPKPLRQLAEIKGFELYVSTTFDRLVIEAVRSVRPLAQELVYSGEAGHAGLASNVLAQPVVFQLFGNLESNLECALTEEEILDFNRRLQKNPPPNVFEKLAEKNLLFLGCEFPGWLGRFLRQLLRGNKPLAQRGFFAHSSLESDPGYGLFLTRNYQRLWQKDAGAGFVDELHRRWNATDKPDAPAPDVFISYASDDRAYAEDLREDLAAKGVRCWIDRANLRAGDVWRDELAKAITDCPLFLPIVSRNTDKAAANRVFREEWKWACGIEGKKICPLLLLSPREIPEAFQRVQLRSFTDMPRLVEEVALLIGRPRGAQ